MRLGIIGTGAICQLLVAVLAKNLRVPLSHVAFLSTPRAIAESAFETLNVAKTVSFHSDISEFLSMKPDFVVECAGQAAVRDCAESILQAGVDLAIVSTGALTDHHFYQKLETAAITGKSRLILSAGAIGGVDILACSRLAGISNMTYTSRKPPAALGNAPEGVVFEGHAGHAASLYPKNANVAATLALAGVGFDETSVTMRSDPLAKGNIHEINFTAGNAEVSIKITGFAHPDNPKTSATTAYALAREVLNRINPIVI
jgi:aspartate dehydrogenase